MLCFVVLNFRNVNRGIWRYLRQLCLSLKPCRDRLLLLLNECHVPHVLRDSLGCPLFRLTLVPVPLSALLQTRVSHLLVVHFRNRLDRWVKVYTFFVDDQNCLWFNLLSQSNFRDGS